ncbi:MAG: chorismate mutase [Verrucomicrobia bacterium]|jgi:chorismate mutase|nr:chorismate mutase [Verrucomicrobiota bacterium]
MNTQLQISHVRNVLIRLEETIIFALIERTQFLQNPPIYEPRRFGDVLEEESLVGFMLLECERSHAKVRRYASPDELPFFAGLPEPILPPLHLVDNPLHANTININSAIRATYEQEIVPHICREGDDDQYGSAAVCDVACLQALSKRIHYGKFVAESKFREAPERLLPAMNEQDSDSLMAAITNQIEEQVLQRVEAKARLYTQELASASTSPTVAPETIVDIYRSWIIPMNKQVQVEYLLQRNAESA